MTFPVKMKERDFKQAERDKLAKKGAAMPDGSFPINNAADLANAIRLAGQASDPAAARRHIIKRAKALGLTAKLPDSWGVQESWRERLAEALGLMERYTAGELALDEVDVGDTPAGKAVAGAVDPEKPGPTLPAKRRDGRIRQAINILIDAMGAMDDDELADPVQQMAADAEAKSRIKSALLAARESLNEALVEEDGADPWYAQQGEGEGDPLDESSSDSGIIMLEEKALRPDGTTKLKLISPGWGTKGYYSADVLKRDGPKAWPVGTHMYWNHPTEQDEANRPERDLRDLAAVTVTPPVFMESGPKGPGLYADAKVFGDYQKPVEEMAPHIGVSIRAAGMANYGTAEGKNGALVESILQGKSIDFVTKPGRGGEILQLFESARGGAYGKPVYDAGHQPSAEDDMSQAELEEAQRKLKEQTDENAKLRKALLVPEAAKLAVSLLAPTTLPGPSKLRLAEAASAEPPITAEGKLDKEAFTATLAESAKAEAAYVAQLTGMTGEVHGLGADPIGEAASNPFAALLSESAGGPGIPAKFDEKAVTDETTALLQGLGLSEAVAKQATAGRN